MALNCTESNANTKIAKANAQYLLVCNRRSIEKKNLSPKSLNKGLFGVAKYVFSMTTPNHIFFKLSQKKYHYHLISSFKTII